MGGEGGIKSDKEHGKFSQTGKINKRKKGNK